MNVYEKKIESVAVTWHPNLAVAKVEAEKIVAELANPKYGKLTVRGWSLYDERFANEVRAGTVDLTITLGGDGTMLRANKICAPYRVPVCGVNMGSFGFMMEIQTNEWRAMLPDLIAGNWRIEERMMLHVELVRQNTENITWEVLNDAVIAHGSQIRPIRVHVIVSGNELTTYVADGLIVATATGSTAYAMAAGGPIMEPDLRNILIIPVAPHLSLDRGLLLDENDVIEITATSNHEAIFSPDGARGVILAPSDKIIISTSKYSARYVRFHGQGFFYRNFLQYMQRNPSAIRRDY